MNVMLKGLNLQVENNNFKLNDIDFIILNKQIIIYFSNGERKALSFDNNEEVFKEISKTFYNAGIEQFVTLKGKRIVNVEKINKVLFGSDGILVVTDNHKVKMSDLNENHARMLADMYFNTPFITDYELTK